MRAADLPVVIINEQPPSLTDSFALLRLLQHKGVNRGAGVLVNQASSADQARHVYTRFSQAVKQLIGLNTLSLGHVFDSPNVTESVLKQVAFVRLYPDSATTVSLDRLARALVRKTASASSSHKGMSAMLKQRSEQVLQFYTEKVFTTALEHAASVHTEKEQVVAFQHALTDICRDRFGEMLEYYQSFQPTEDDELPGLESIKSALDAISGDDSVEKQLTEYKQHKPEPVPLPVNEEQVKPAADISRDEIDALKYCSDLGPYIRQS